MGQRVYFRHRQIGSSIRSVDSRIQRTGISQFQGTDRTGVHVEKNSPNFDFDTYWKAIKH